MTQTRKDQSIDPMPVILINDAALTFSSDLVASAEGTKVIIAGPSSLRMTLAELALPDAQVILADFSQSASLAALNRRVRTAGRLDRLILAGNGADIEQMFSLMRTIVTFLPELRRGRGSGIRLVVEDGRALASLRQFLRRVQPTFERYGIALDLTVQDSTASQEFVRP